MKRLLLIFLVLALMVNAVSEAAAIDSTERSHPQAMPQQVEDLFENYCASCHDEASSKLEDKLRRPDYGNYVDHDKLFSGEYADVPAFTFDGRWLIGEFIFDAKFHRLLHGAPAKIKFLGAMPGQAR